MVKQAQNIPNSGFRIPNSSIALLGSTGSIGRQTLEVVSMLGLRVVSLCADRNITLLEEQVRRFQPDIAVVFNEDASRDFRTRVRDLDVKVLSGAEGLVEAACANGADTVITATTGTAGLLPTLAAIKLGRRIALANKETLVCAGELVMRLARDYGADIIPVDSEHSAILQCIGTANSDTIKRIILTASGGPFRGMSREELSGVTPDMALRHPTWSMGQKITIDSATLMNKGLEIIEAVHLFGVQAEKIDVVVHPQSVIHSMVEFTDNSTLAQLAAPDMRLPIQNALTYPDKEQSMIPSLDFTAISELTFERPNMEAFPCLRLAKEIAGAGGTACAVLNGANEAAVDLFLKGKLGFYGISDTIKAALDKIKNIEEPSLDEIIEAEEEAKEFVYAAVDK